MVSRENTFLVRGNTFGDILVSQGNTFWCCQWGKEEKRREEKKRRKWSAREISGPLLQENGEKYFKKKPSTIARTRNLLRIK
jgi:hypothetical protein